jgi:hypothetical protein
MVWRGVAAFSAIVPVWMASLGPGHREKNVLSHYFGAWAARPEEVHARDDGGRAPDAIRPPRR